MAININNEKDTGIIIACSTSTMLNSPLGFLKCDGSAVSRTDFSRLFSVIGTTYGTGNGSTTFNLPDLRGEFLRGFDDGRTVDSGRVIGTVQSAQNLSHSHTVNSHSHDLSNHTHISGPFAYNAGLFGSLSGNSVQYAGAWNDLSQTPYTGGPSSNNSGSTSPGTNSNGGTDLRPRNVAVSYFIKY